MEQIIDRPDGYFRMVSEYPPRRECHLLPSAKEVSGEARTVSEIFETRSHCDPVTISSTEPHPLLK